MLKIVLSSPLRGFNMSHETIRHPQFLRKLYLTYIQKLSLFPHFRDDVFINFTQFCH